MESCLGRCSGMYRCVCVCVLAPMARNIMGQGLQERWMSARGRKRSEAEGIKGWIDGEKGDKDSSRERGREGGKTEQ